MYYDVLLFLRQIAEEDVRIGIVTGRGDMRFYDFPGLP
jgi:hypothetical protein